MLFKELSVFILDFMQLTFEFLFTRLYPNGVPPVVGEDVKIQYFAYTFSKLKVDAFPVLEGFNVLRTACKCSGQLKLLRDMLPRGSRGMIKSNTTFSYSYIDQVLKGKRHNLVIMNKALGIARKIMLSKKMTSMKFQEIMAMLNGAETPSLPQTPETPTT